MSRHRIAVVEDEPVIRQAVVDALTFAGFDVVQAADGESGLACATGPDVDLVLLDLMLPRLDGLDVLARLRRLRPGLPVIVLTSKGSEEDIVRGLRDGADDYVVKPFGARELLARVHAVLRRSVGRPQPVTRARLGDREVDFESREVRAPDGTTAVLTPAEGAVLSFLVENRGRAISREELLGRLWGVWGSKANTRTTDMHVARLRAKLGDDADPPRLIVTVRGKGYLVGEGE